jgi:hypothetical protein
VDFGRLEKADRVVVDTTPDQRQVRLRLEGQTRSDAPWERLAESPAETRLPTPPNLRHLATSEIKWQGIEYLLASPSDFWDKDIRNNPRDWGLTPVAEKNDYRLYRID